MNINCVKRTLLLVVISLVFSLSFAQNLLINGDFEGKEFTCFNVNGKDKNTATELQKPKIISDDYGNHYTTITGKEQLYITLPQPLQKGSYVVLSMKTKADDDCSFDIGLSSSTTISLKQLNKRYYIRSEWKTITDTIYIYNDNVQLFAIQPVAYYKDYNYCFDDINIEFHSYSLLGPGGFKVYTPVSDRIKQGDRISISYAIDARITDYELRNIGGIEGAILDNLDSYSRNDKTTFNCKYTMLVAGKLKVLPMTLVVDGKKVCSDSAYIDVLSDSVAEAKCKIVIASWKIANEFLETKGVKYHNLVCKYETETLCVFSDDLHGCFAIVALEPYAQYLDNPILAYGINEFPWPDNNMNKKADDDVVNRVILNQYDQQLRYLFEKKKKYNFNFSTDYRAGEKEVNPLLGDIAYGQRYPYNKFFPYDNMSTGKKEHCVTGCTAVAMAQVLSYYHIPVQLKGTSTVTTLGGFSKQLDLSKYPVKWDGTEDDIASLVYNCAASISSDMTSKSSSSNAVDAISALVNIWGYSNSCKLILNKNGDKEWTSLYSDLDNGYVFKYDGGQEAYMVDDITMWYSLYDELDNERPVIIGGGNHAYVCDGFDNEYIHYNFGWDGIYNGYYRTIILPEIEVKGSSHIKYCIIGITPPDLTPLTD